MTWPVPMPVVGSRMEAAVILAIGLLVKPFVNPFDMKLWSGGGGDSSSSTPNSFSSASRSSSL